MFASFSGIMLVLGGSGITFGTSVLEDMVAKKLSGAARAMCINFVWVVQQPCKCFSAGKTKYKAKFELTDTPDLLGIQQRRQILTCPPSLKSYSVPVRYPA